MKVKHLLEDHTEEPILIEIIRQLLNKGVMVRAYYNGDGGEVANIEWKPLVHNSFVLIHTKNATLNIHANRFDELKFEPINLMVKGKVQKTYKLAPSSV